MTNTITDETIEYVGILAKLELSDEEKEQAKNDMGRMLDYIDKLLTMRKLYKNEYIQYKYFTSRIINWLF